MADKRRQHIFSENCTAHNVAPCCICGKPIHRHDDRWIVEHERALALLGDVNTNCGPAHYDCAQVKTHTEAPDQEGQAPTGHARGDQRDFPPLRAARRHRLRLAEA
jgi:hypothetical protein